MEYNFTIFSKITIINWSLFPSSTLALAKIHLLAHSSGQPGAGGPVHRTGVKVMRVVPRQLPSAYSLFLESGKSRQHKWGSGYFSYFSVTVREVIGSVSDGNNPCSDL